MVKVPRNLESARESAMVAVVVVDCFVEEIVMFVYKRPVKSDDRERLCVGKLISVSPSTGPCDNPAVSCARDLARWVRAIGEVCRSYAVMGIWKDDKRVGGSRR